MNKDKNKLITSMEIGTLLEIKYPLIHLRNDNGYTIWFYDHKDNIVTFNDYYVNYPRWAMCIHTREEMIEEAKKLIQEGKEIVHIDEDLEELKEFF